MNNKTKKIVSGVVALALLCGTGIGGYAIGKNAAEKPIVEQVQPVPMPDIEEDIQSGATEGVEVVPNNTKTMSLKVTKLSTPVSMLSNDLPEGLADDISAMSDDYGIATAAATTSYSITATVTPADASNKVLDWAVAWENPSSTFAKGKTVTDYVTITPNSSTLGATLTCTQAFGEKIILSVHIHDDESVSATANVNYRQKCTGNNFSMTCQWAANVTKGSWNLTTSNLNPTVDFINIRASGLDLQEWGLGYCDKSNTTTKVTAQYNSTYTVKNGGLYVQEVSIAPTADYLNVLKAAGFTTTATAGTYYTFSNGDSNTGNQLAFGNILLGRYVSNANAINDAKVAAWRSGLLSNASKTMLQLKVHAVDEFGEQVDTVYNIKFSTSSLSVRAAFINLSGGDFNF